MTGTDDKILLILDLDETLVHATENPKNGNWDFQIGKYKVYKRPGLDQFLSEVKIHFDVAVWSSASDDYVAQVVEKIFPQDYPLVFIWGRSKCTLQYDHQSIEDSGHFDHQNHMNYSKVLKKVKKKGYSALQKTLIIDDTPNKCKNNYGNAIYPKAFNGEADDNELALLMQYLLKLKNVNNVRIIEKRNWKEQIH